MRTPQMLLLNYLFRMQANALNVTEKTFLINELTF